MKTIIWKELREHARWIPLGVIPMIIILVLKWRSNELIFEAAEYGIFPLSLSSLVGLVASGVALCLGILQSWPDQRPAARALLLHRGITADAAFCGKLLAGLLLYVIAVIVPLLGMAVFIATVGIEHRAASPEALLPAALTSIAAFGCWPASLLVVQRDAWFLGSRLMPAVTAAVVVLVCGALSNYVFWLACAISLVAVVGLLVAAHRVFVDSGHVATGWGRVGLAVFATVTLWTGMLCVISVVAMYRMASARSNGGVNYLYAADFGPDGEPWLTRSFYSNRLYDYEVDQVAKMLPGRSVREQLQPLEDGWRQLDKWSMSEFMEFSAGSGRRFVSLGYTSVANSPGQTYHHLVLDTRLDAVLLYRVGMNPRYRLEAKLLPPTPVASFGEARTHLSSFDRAGNFRLVSSTGVYCIPSSGADVELIYAVPSESKRLGAGLRGPRGMRVNDAPFELLLRHDDRIVLLESDLNSATAGRAQSLGEFTGLDEVLRTEVRLPREVAAALMIAFARDPLRDNSYLCLTQDSLQYDKSIHWVRFDESGQITQHELYDNDTQTAEVIGGEWGVAMVPPGTWAITAAVMAIESGRTLPAIADVWKLSKSDPSKAAWILFRFLLQPMIGVPLAIWAARRRSLDKWSTNQWICWAFWFGPCGSLALLAVYPRILREPCGGCHRATRIDLTSCEHCGHSLDETPQTGIEIFDQPQTASEITAQPAAM